MSRGFWITKVISQNDKLHSISFVYLLFNTRTVAYGSANSLSGPNFSHQRKFYDK